MSDSDSENDNHSGFSSVGMVLAGLGIGAALAYGASKLRGSGTSSENPSGESSRAKRPRVIDVIDKEYDCSSAMNRIESETQDYPVVGLDCEWQNNWDGNVSQQKIALLSISTAKGYCALLRLRNWNSMPSKLKTFLSNEKIIKVGVGIDIDRNKLQADYGLQLFGSVDLRFIAKEKGYETRKLKYLAQVIVGITLSENDHSHWNDDPLPQDCIEYAGMDVYASIEIMKKLVPSKYEVFDVCLPYINGRFTSIMNNF